MVVISRFMTLEQFVSRLKYDRNVPRNRLKSWFMYFCFRIKILKGNPCAGLLFEIVHTTVLFFMLSEIPFKAFLPLEGNANLTCCTV